MSVPFPHKQVERILASVPRKRHHPWPTRRAYKLGLCGQNGIPYSSIRLESYEHFAVHLAFGNGSPDEDLQWIRENRFNLSSLICVVIFGGEVTKTKAAEIFEARYTKRVDPAVVRAFASQPFTFEKRWFGGVSREIRRAHLIALHSLLPQDLQDRYPLRLAKKYRLAE